jgi:hypothetical protein
MARLDQREMRCAAPRWGGEGGCDDRTGTEEAGAMLIFLITRSRRFVGSVLDFAETGAQRSRSDLRMTAAFAGGRQTGVLTLCGVHDRTKLRKPTHRAR